jgi:hypothetical protein
MMRAVTVIELKEPYSDIPMREPIVVEETPTHLIFSGARRILKKELSYVPYVAG